MAAFTPGDLVISISGDGDGSGSYTDNQASPIVLEQINPATGAVVAITGVTNGTLTPSGALVLPQQSSTGPNGATESAVSGEYGSSSEGLLQLSADGQSLVIGGYGVNAAAYNAAESNGNNVYGNAALAQSTSVPNGTYIPVSRVAVDIDADGVVDSSTALLNVFNTNNIRSVATVNGSSFYVSGQGVKGDTTQGVFYAQDGATGATAIDTSTDTREAEIYDNQLYVSRDSTQSTNPNIGSYGTEPTMTTAATPLPGLSGEITLTAAQDNGVNNGQVGKGVYLSPESYFFADATTLYVADSGRPKNGSKGGTGLGDGGLQKWTLNNGTWTLDYTLSSGLNLVNNSSATSGTTGLIGLTGAVSGNTVQLYATNETLTDTGQTYLYSITDQLNATVLPTSETFKPLVPAAAGTNIRGIAFAPQAAATSSPPVKPTITGTHATPDAGEATVMPFSGVMVMDGNQNATDTLSITPSGGGGTLTGAGTPAGGVYTLTGTATEITDQLDALTFTPTNTTPNATATTTFQLVDLSSAGTRATDSGTTVTDLAAAVPPTITNTSPPATSTNESPATPFTQATVTNPNADGGGINTPGSAADTLTITLQGGTGMLSEGTSYSGTPTLAGGNGTYTLTGTGAQITAELDGLVFTPAKGAPASVTTTVFQLSDVSSVGGASNIDATSRDTDTDSAAPPTVMGGTAGQQTTSEATVAGVFAGVTVSDPNAGTPIETVTVTVGGAGGTLAGGGIMPTGTAGTYVLTGTMAQVNTALGQVSFTPNAGQANTRNTTTFSIVDASSADATASAPDTTPSVVDTDPAVAPTVTGGGATATTQNMAVTPFASASVADPNADSTDTLSIQVQGSGTLSGSGLGGGMSGLYTLSGSAAAVTGELQALTFTPAANAPGTTTTTTFALTDTTSAGPSATNAGTSVTDTVAPAPAPTPAPGAISISQQVYYTDGVFDLSGTASAAAGPVEISAVIDNGQRVDLGAAPVNANGTWTFADAIGPHLQSFLTATQADGMQSPGPLISLQGGLGANGQVGQETLYSAGGASVDAVENYSGYGQRFLSEQAPGQTVDLQPFDVIRNHYQGDDTFVYQPGPNAGANDVIGGFRLRGTNHDTLALPSSDFANFAALLGDTKFAGDTATITDPNTGGKITLHGVDEAALKAHPKDFTFG